ncbi:MAG: glycerophosphodiester phosphodiesterase [Bacilli bacterium]|nr:glycerophosphodiester phosphodiesterase [Bacilli bacterium]
MSFLSNAPIAHRGIHNNIDIPENSIKAFSLAITKHCTIELDIHLLKDNEIVVFHDDNLKRMTGIDKDIKNCTYKELSNIKLLNTNYTIPTLKEVLNLVDGKVPIIVELKYDNKVGKLEKEVVKELDNYSGKFCIQSFHPMIVRWFKKNRPNYLRGLLVPSYGKSIKRIILASMILKPICSPNFISVDRRRNNKRLLKKNIETIVWTIKSKKDYEKCVNKYDNLIIDDINILK